MGWIIVATRNNAIPMITILNFAKSSKFSRVSGDFRNIKIDWIPMNIAMAETPTTADELPNARAMYPSAATSANGSQFSNFFSFAPQAYAERKNPSAKNAYGWTSISPDESLSTRIGTNDATAAPMRAN